MLCGNHLNLLSNNGFSSFFSTCSIGFIISSGLLFFIILEYFLLIKKLCPQQYNSMMQLLNEVDENLMSNYLITVKLPPSLDN